MKKNKLWLSIIFLAFFCKGIAQKNYLQNPDSPTKCENIKSGTFMSLEIPEEEWKMEVKDGLQTEYFENGQYIKSKQYFDLDNPCKFHVIVTEISDQTIGISKGSVFENTILQTELNMIRIKSENKETGIILTLEKIKE